MSLVLRLHCSMRASVQSIALDQLKPVTLSKIQQPNPTWYCSVMKPKPTKLPLRQRSRSSNWSIALLPGLSSEDEAKLLESGIQTTQQLLQRGKTPTQRQVLATQLHIHIQHVNKWVALANLAQIPAVGCQYCGLLLHAGISSPSQLAQTPLPRLHRLMVRLYVAMMQQPELCPSLDQVAQWIEQARLLGNG